MNFDVACRALQPLRGEPVAIDRAGIEARLPHRAPFLLLDRVTHVADGWICAERELDRGDPVFAGHFPGSPVWPGVLQVEAIGQAGILAYQLALGEDVSSIALTHVCGARFARPARPGETVEVVAEAREDGLFFDVVGQCRVNGAVVSAAHVRGVIG